ncbi:MAG: DNA replication and repair protein RecF [Microgenomates group bacterium Gr01-1014_7]|nr:MAG: DNA replication and repair protein RecF [Microgenomates group bacterium Gr01-1014_7]
MFLKAFNLTNFRNYARLELNFDTRPTILVGNNAAGKSNLLEAIYLLSTTKSLRVETEDELIKEGEEFVRVEGFFRPEDDQPLAGGSETELLVIINRSTEQVSFRKKVMVNGISKRAVDFIGNLPAVIFYPQDINMVTGAPSLRRWHLDLSLAQVDSSYKKTLTLYEQILTNRNRVLKSIREGQGKADELKYWTDELAEKGEGVRVKREEFFKFINNLESPLGDFRFEYLQSPISVERLRETNGREVAAAATLIGPHRDDFVVTTLSEVEGQGSRDLAHFGSRGEQRTATLAFKLAQLEYMAKILGKRPILLLDDVFSELDANHRAHVVEIVGKQQTIIATVELENIPKSFLDSARILKVEDGKISGS